MRKPPSGFFSSFVSFLLLEIQKEKRKSPSAYKADNLIKTPSRLLQSSLYRSIIIMFMRIYKEAAFMDERTLAFINLHAVLGGLAKLCELDPECKALIEGKTISIGISVKDGPEGTIRFENGVCTVTPGVDKCDIKLPFGSCKKFNGLIDGTVTPIPSKGFTKIGFLLKEFTKLTDKLTAYLRPVEGALDDPDFFRISTTVMLHLILDAVAQIGNQDKVGRASASYIVDGNVRIGIDGGPEGYIHARNHTLTAVHTPCDDPTSYMIFATMRDARDLFDGKVNGVVCVGSGKVRMGGMISMVDNVNRILDRVSMYLA